MRPRVLTAAILAPAIALAACDRAKAPILPAALEAISPAEQTGVVGATVEQPPAVRVLGTDGRPVAGVDVQFTVSAGGGTVSASGARTDSRGEARLGSWRLGTIAGDNVLTVSVPGTSALTFRATARAGAPTQLSLLTAPATLVPSGALLVPHPVIQLLDEYGNAAPVAGVSVTASVAPATATLDEHVVTTDARGSAEFVWLRLLGPAGTYTLTFSAPGLAAPAAGAALTLVPEEPGICSGAVPLAFALGETRRVTLDRPRGLTCLEFDRDRSAGHQYLLLFENMPLYGEYGSALFDAARLGQPLSPHAFSFTLQSQPSNATAGTAGAVTRRLSAQAVPVEADHAWDFGAGRIYEIRPEPPPGGVPEPYISSGGRQYAVASSTRAPVVGDTIHGIWMERLTHLNIPSGQQSAVVRFVSDELVIAEDVRLATLERQGGGVNTPLHPDTLRAIATEYAKHARQQSDLLFDGRHNAAVENLREGRVLAVHSIMYASNIWGYTYSSSDYFVFDYWVGTNGTTGGLNQRVQRVVDNLFMHEISHMRELGMLQRAAVTNRRGNQWFVEGFARFSERLPIAARLLDSTDPSRTANLVLPLNPAFGNAFFRDDVPTYLNLASAAFAGYQNSSYIFDYFADQVALQGGNWRAALREFAVAAGRPAVLDDVTMRWTGATLPELFTRARIALYLDDIGTPGLPAWTQYHQFQLRASRPPTTAAASDPRNAFPRLIPGQVVDVSHNVGAGAAWGYVVDGTQAATGARYLLTGPTTANAVLSITRIR